MKLNNMNLDDLSKMPEQEFKQYFHDWMEQDNIARSLQAKLRKDLFHIFNKTTLGRKLLAQAATCNRLVLSPLILCLNTLVAEFLYAQNCHFTLSVFCTEVPYRNTLPDFEGARQFRFSETEIFEIFNALSGSWGERMQEEIQDDYLQGNETSLLFILFKHLLKRMTVEKVIPPPTQEAEQVQFRKDGKSTPTSEKLEPKRDCRSNEFSPLNKYLMVLSKKVQQLNLEMEGLRQQNYVPQTGKKTLRMRKFENLNRSLEKVSENLRKLVASKRKNKKLSVILSAMDSMAKQFEKCAAGFNQMGNTMPQAEKSYHDWIAEMRDTENGKIFLERIEAALRKTLRQQRLQFENDRDKALRIQNKRLREEYDKKLAEELKIFKRKATATPENIIPAQGPILQVTPTKTVDIMVHHKGSQTADDTAVKKNAVPTQTSHHLYKIMKTSFKQERQVDHIVFNAKLRIQELEHESNQLDRSFRNYLDRQRDEKEKLRESAAHIWESYSLSKAALNKRFAQLCTQMEQPPPTTTGSMIPEEDGLEPSAGIPRLTVTSADPPAFENAFRVAQKKVLANTTGNVKIIPQQQVELLQSNEFSLSAHHSQAKVTLVVRPSSQDSNRNTLSPVTVENSPIAARSSFSRIPDSKGPPHVGRHGENTSPPSDNGTTSMSVDSSGTDIEVQLKQINSDENQSKKRRDSIENNTSLSGDETEDDVLAQSFPSDLSSYDDIDVHTELGAGI